MSKNGKVVEIKCQGAKTLKLSEMNVLQGALKTLSDETYKNFKVEIARHGYSEPIGVWQNKKKWWILSGTQRHTGLSRMEKEGWTVPALPVSVIEASSLQEAHEKVLSLATVLGDITKDSLKNYVIEHQIDITFLKTLKLPNINFQGVIDKYMETKSGGKTDPDEVPKVKKGTVKSGDIWKLGDHKLMCGDSLNLDYVRELMNDCFADMVFTDPPYNVDYVGKTKEALKIQNDKMENSEFYKFLLKAFTHMRNFTSPGGAIYICHADGEGLNFRKAMIDAGWLMKQCIVWVKNSIVMGRQDYHWQHEPILYGWAENGSHKWYGDRKQSTVWPIARPTKSEDHPTMKPIELIEKAIENSSKPGDLILDLFGGSGSTLIACEKANRKANLMELSPHYCDVIIKRWEDYTGRKATLMGNTAKK